MKMSQNTNNPYSGYEKIVPSENLVRFLFYFFTRQRELPWIKKSEEKTFNEQMYCSQLQSSAVKKYAKYRLLFVFLDKFFLKLFAPKNKEGDKKNILFYSLNYCDILREAKKYHNVGLLACGRKDRLFAAKNFMGYVNVDDLDQYLLAYLKEKDMEYLFQLIKKLEEKLTAACPDYIVLSNDILPMDRAVILVAKKLGIVTIEIQHGLYVESDIRATKGSIVDYILVWGQYFKELYVKSDIRKPEDIYVLGYPYAVEKHYPLENKKQYTVCCLGENFNTFNKDLLKIELDFVNNIFQICKRKKLNFIYRPHPSDDRELLEKKLPDVKFTSKGEKLKETFGNADIFISFISTSLIEAAIRSKICLELTNYPVKLEIPDYERLGVCNKTLQTYGELENYLDQIIESPNVNKFKLNFNNDYVETRYNPGQRFLEVIKELNNKKI